MISNRTYSKTCHKWSLKRRPKLGFKTDYRLMQVKSIAECIKLVPSVFKTFVLSTFEWPIKTGFTVLLPMTVCVWYVKKIITTWGGTSLALCILGYFPCFCLCLLTFFKINLFQKLFRNTIRATKGLDQDQNPRSVRPDLGPNCLQRSSADDKSPN